MSFALSVFAVDSAVCLKMDLFVNSFDRILSWFKTNAMCNSCCISIHLIFYFVPVRLEITFMEFIQFPVKMKFSIWLFHHFASRPKCNKTLLQFVSLFFWCRKMSLNCKIKIFSPIELCNLDAASILCLLVMLYILCVRTTVSQDVKGNGQTTTTAQWNRSKCIFCLQFQDPPLSKPLHCISFHALAFICVLNKQNPIG